MLLLGVTVLKKPSALDKEVKPIYDTQHLELSALPESPKSQGYIQFMSCPMSIESCERQIRDA